MTYPADCTLPDTVLEHLARQGLDGLPELLRPANDLEQLNQEIRCRTRPVGIFSARPPARTWSAP